MVVSLAVAAIGCLSVAAVVDPASTPSAHLTSVRSVRASSDVGGNAPGGVRWTATSYLLRLPGEAAPLATPQQPTNVVSVGAKVEGGASPASIFGISTSRTLVLTVGNPGVVPAKAVVTAAWGRSLSATTPLGTPVMLDLAPGRTVTVSLPFTLPALSMGSYHVVGLVAGSAPTVAAITTTTTWPWGIPLALVVLLVLAMVARERSRRQLLAGAHAPAHRRASVSPGPVHPGVAAARAVATESPSATPYTVPPPAPVAGSVLPVGAERAVSGAPGAVAVSGSAPSAGSTAGALRINDVWLIGVVDGVATTVAVAVLSVDPRGVGVTDAASYGQRILARESVRNLAATAWLGQPDAPAGLIEPGAIVVVQTDRATYRFAAPGRSAGDLVGLLAEASRGWFAAPVAPVMPGADEGTVHSAVMAG